MALPPPHLKARKRFGQNFLVDESVIASIVNAINPQPQEYLVEIGPGHAALTRPVLERAGALTAIELDRDLVEILSHDPFLKGLTLIEADALKFDFTSLEGASDNSLRVFGNLPYNITSPLIFHLLNQPGIKDMHFMLQKEVVERLGAGISSSDYGRLTVMVQYLADVIPLIVVPPEAFRPRPKVTSAVVRLRPKELSDEARSLVPFMSEITRVAFSARRKTVRNALSSLFTPEELSSAGIDLMLRPEDLTVEQYRLLSCAYKARKNVSDKT